MPPPVLRYKGKIIWYPGIVFGKPPPEIDWSTGQGLGASRLAGDPQSDSDGAGLVWTSTERLLVDLEHTQSLDGVLAALQLSLSVLTEPADLLLAALRALARLCWGFRDRVLYAVRCGACEHVCRVLHWHWSSESDAVSLAALQLVIMLGDHGGRAVRLLLGSLGLPGYLTVTIKWNRLNKKNSGDVVHFACKALYQLAIGGGENRLLLRRAGADKELYCLSRYPFFLPQLQQQQVRDQALQVLAVLRDQLLSDLAPLPPAGGDCWLVLGAVRMAVADMRHWDPLRPDAGRGGDLVQTGLHALLRLLAAPATAATEGEVDWNATTELTLHGACELLVEVSRHTACVVSVLTDIHHICRILITYHIMSH
jgi:hypothetical protein